MPEKALLHDLEAEEEVIGSLLTDSLSMQLVSDWLSPDDFLSDKTRVTYQACCNLYSRSEAISQSAVFHELNSMGKQEVIGGEAYLTYLVSNCRLDIEYYADIVHNLSKIRHVIRVGEKIVQLGCESQRFDELYDKARMLLDETLYSKRIRRLDLGRLKIIKTSPPHYEWNVNEQNITFSLSEILSWNNFRRRVTAELDFIPRKPKNWEEVVNQHLEQSTKEEAPADTSPDVETILSVKQHFEQRGEGWEASDLRLGCYVIVKHITNSEEKDYWVFQRNPLLRVLKKEMGQSMTAGRLWTILTHYGAIKLQKRIGTEEKQPLKLWALPADFADDLEYQIEEEELPDI